MDRSTRPSEVQTGADLPARLAELEARVERLETGTTQATVTSPPPADRPGGDDADTFWALHGLSDRCESPGAVLMAGTVDLPEGGRAEWQQQFGTDAVLEADWSLSADTLAALGHPIRLVLLRQVMRGVRTTAELGESEELGTTGQLYHHLRQLVAVGWLRPTGRGRYEVPASRVVPLLIIIGGTQP